MDLSDNEKALLKWGVAFIYEAGVHSPQAAANAVNLTNLVGRLTDAKPLPEMPKKEPAFKNVE
jgi:hypothetical protein